MKKTLIAASLALMTVMTTLPAQAGGAPGASAIAQAMEKVSNEPKRGEHKAGKEAFRSRIQDECGERLGEDAPAYLRASQKECVTKTAHSIRDEYREKRNDAREDHRDEKREQMREKLEKACGERLDKDASDYLRKEQRACAEKLIGEKKD